MCLCPFEPELQRLLQVGIIIEPKYDWQTTGGCDSCLVWVSLTPLPPPPNDSLSSLLLFTLLLHWKTIHVICLFVIIGLLLCEDFWKMIFWLVLKLEISYQVIICWRLLGFSLRGFFSKNIYIYIYFGMVKYLSFHNCSSFALTYFFNVNGKAMVWCTPCSHV